MLICLSLQNGCLLGGYFPRVGPYAGQRSDGNLQKPAIRNRMLTSISTICEQMVSKVCSVTVTAGSMPLLRPNFTVSRLTKTVWTKTASKRGKNVQKLSTNLASTCYRISKTTMQCFIKQSRGLKAYRRPQQPKISEK